MERFGPTLNEESYTFLYTAYTILIMTQFILNNLWVNQSHFHSSSWDEYFDITTAMDAKQMSTHEFPSIVTSTVDGKLKNKHRTNVEKFSRSISYCAAFMLFMDLSRLPLLAINPQFQSDVTLLSSD